MTKQLPQCNQKLLAMAESTQIELMTVKCTGPGEMAENPKPNFNIVSLTTQLHTPYKL